jgi:hypothetical protein
MRALLIGLLTVAGIAIAMPVSVSPTSAQGVTIETPVGGLRMGPERRFDRDYDRPRYGETTGFRERSYDRGCRTITIRRDDGSVRQIRRCD